MEPAEWIDRLEIQSLPRLPIPDLKVTLEKYLWTLSPALSKEEFEKTRKEVAVFLEKEGPLLHDELLRLASDAKTSWLEGFWDSMYLEIRDPLPINVNPFFVFQDDPLPAKNTQIARAATLTRSTLWFIKQIRKGQLEPDRERTKTLCMSQYRNMFGSMRIPRYGRDIYVTNFESKHIVVLALGQFYSFQVLNKNNKPMQEGALRAYMQAILEDAWTTREESPETIFPVGIFTTLPRDEWASQHNKLRSLDPKNAETLDVLKSALFVVCLDDVNPVSLTSTAKTMLHSDGKNRWFDKTIQLIICGNGKSGINMEHTGIDGHTCLRFATDVYNHSVRNRCTSPLDPGARPIAQDQDEVIINFDKLSWVLDPQLRDAVDRSAIIFDKFIQRTQTVTLHFTGYGKRFIVNHRMSPDALLQMSYQLAYFRHTGKPAVSTYESAMTKAFYHGRTECLRTVTPDVINFLNVMASSSSTPEDQVKALKQAAKTHVMVMKSCKSGKGVDRHLYGLYWLAKQKQQRTANYEIPSMYTDAAWSKIRHDVLSTSNCGGYALSLFGFGPTASDGFGIGYIIKDTCVHLAVTNFNDEARQFVNTITKTLLDLGSLLEEHVPVRTLERRMKASL